MSSAFSVTDSGRVVGIQIREGYHFPKAGSGKVKTIGVKKGLVCATAASRVTLTTA